MLNFKVYAYNATPYIGEAAEASPLNNKFVPKFELNSYLGLLFLQLLPNIIGESWNLPFLGFKIMLDILRSVQVKMSKYELV